MAEPEPAPRRSLIQRRPKVTLFGAQDAGLAVSWGLQSVAAPSPRLAETPVYLAVVNDSAAPGLKPLGADVTVVVFTDYRCGVCKLSEPVLLKRVARDPRIRVLYKEWPILGADSRLAARVALAADRQGKYLPVHQALMAASGRLDPDTVRRIAERAGADWPRLQSDLQQHGRDIDADLARNNLQAFSLGLEGTPAFLIGPYLIKGRLRELQLGAKLAASRRTHESAGLALQQPTARGVAKSSRITQAEPGPPAQAASQSVTKVARLDSRA